MNLLLQARDIQEQMLFLAKTECERVSVTVRALRWWGKQRGMWRTPISDTERRH